VSVTGNTYPRRGGRRTRDTRRNTPSIEEPGAYNDEERVRGTYRLRVVTEN